MKRVRKLNTAPLLNARAVRGALAYAGKHGLSERQAFELYRQFFFTALPTGMWKAAAA